MISDVPKGLVNINFGTHNCVHMGTQLESDICAYEPSDVSFPAENGKQYTLVSLIGFGVSSENWTNIGICYIVYD